jgi:hypothetical protein
MKFVRRYVGAATIAPDWEEWDRPGIVPYSPDRKDLAEVLNGALAAFGTNGDQPHPGVIEGREYIDRHLRLPHLNGMRWRVLNALAAVAG